VVGIQLRPGRREAAVDEHYQAYLELTAYIYGTLAPTWPTLQMSALRRCRLTSRLGLGGALHRAPRR
jgi:hypothetical protein